MSEQRTAHPNLRQSSSNSLKTFQTSCHRSVILSSLVLSSKYKSGMNYFTLQFSSNCSCTCTFQLCWSIPTLYTWQEDRIKQFTSHMGLCIEQILPYRLKFSTLSLQANMLFLTLKVCCSSLTENAEKVNVSCLM